MGVVISKKVKRKISKIFEHPGNIYSVYLKNSEEVTWIEGKVELYRFLRSLEE